MKEFDYKKFLVENKLTLNSRLLKEEAKTYTADEISRGKASDAQSNDIGDYQFGVKVVPAKSYRDEEEVKNNVMTVKKIDDNPQNPRSIIATLLSDEKVEKQYEPADLYLYTEDLNEESEPMEPTKGTGLESDEHTFKIKYKNTPVDIDAEETLILALLKNDESAIQYLRSYIKDIQLV